MKRKTRKILAFFSFLLFPLTLNFFSPYVGVDGAMNGVVSGSLIVFGVMFLSGLFFRRAWCSYVCPWAAPSEYLQSINDRPVNRKRLAILRYSIFGLWFGVIVASFIFAGGIRGIDPLHLTETGISIDEPMKFITYYLVIGLLFLITVLVGRRGACQSICWMSPFLIFGSWVGEKLRLPQFLVRSLPDKCISCQKCNTVCPMSIDVNALVKIGKIGTFDCILCGQCVDACPKKVLSIRMKQK
jgi:ferredoxin-type protein NapH